MTKMELRMKRIVRFVCVGALVLIPIVGLLVIVPNWAFGAGIDPQIIADGKPWNAAKADGMTMRLILNPAGDGKFIQGSMGMALKWKVTRDVMCISPSMGPKRCMTFVPVPGGYDGMTNGKLELLLRR
jgi:hypothetical protein